MDYKDIYEAGRKYGDLCNHSWNTAMYYDTPFTDSDMMQWDYASHRFFEAGFDGDDFPEIVQAVRFGKIPESGRSINWAENQCERGVSCVKIIRDQKDLDYKSIYDVTLCGRDKYIVEGYYFGDYGSDGEPLLVNAKIIKGIEE